MIVRTRVRFHLVTHHLDFNRSFYWTCPSLATVCVHPRIVVPVPWTAVFTNGYDNTRTSGIVSVAKWSYLPTRSKHCRPRLHMIHSPFNLSKEIMSRETKSLHQLSGDGLPLPGTDTVWFYCDSVGEESWLEKVLPCWDSIPRHFLC